MTVRDLKVGDEIGSDKIIYMVNYLTTSGYRNFLFIVYQEKLDRYRLIKSDSSRILYTLKYYHSNMKSALTRLQDIVTEEVKQEYD